MNHYLHTSPGFQLVCLFILFRGACKISKPYDMPFCGFSNGGKIRTSEDRLKFIDDLSVLQLVCLSGVLTDYDFLNHVASDIGIDDQFLSPDTNPTQANLNFVSNWTNENLMKLNEQKCNYMVFSRSEAKFATRLNVNNVYLERVPVTKILGIWLSEDLSWAKNS